VVIVHFGRGTLCRCRHWQVQSTTRRNALAVICIGLARGTGHPAPRMSAASRYCAGVNLAGACNARHKASCC
jgi:hypothetical protein